MDPSMPNAPRRSPSNASSSVRISPPESKLPSPQNMVPPHHNPFAIAPAGRAPGLSAPIPQLGPRSPGGYGSSPYNHPYGTSSTSPSTASGGLQDGQPNDPPMLSVAGISPTHISSSSLNAQKRAYRQRRKDPSCDACRERKVKCDATETTACSECSSRNHKCQFTKETNRRMSSIKQVQDLQSQLAELRQENTHLRTRVIDRDAMDIDKRPGSNRRTDSNTSLQNGTPQRAQTPILKHFDHVRRNMRTYCRGIFDPPSTSRPVGASISGPPGLPELPARSDYAHFARSYFDSIHEVLPLIHWPTFQNEVDQLYTARSFESVSKEWTSVFFAVAACGSLHTPHYPSAPSKGRTRGTSYYETAAHVLRSSSHEMKIAHPQAALLLSVFALESGMKVEGSIWLATAVRTAQMLNLHVEKPSSAAVEGEVQQRLWWAIYTWDRMSSLGANLPMLIGEEDSSVSLPSALEDRYIQSQGFAKPRTSQPPFAGFLATVQIARLYLPIAQALKSSFVAADILQSSDEKFHSTLMLLPDTYHVGFDGQLEMAAIPPVFALQSARFYLFRHNISPICRPPERLEALRRCTSVAQDTAKYVSRSLLPAPGRHEDLKHWQTQVAALASTVICTHLWRCILMLCFHADHDGALLCFRMLSAAGAACKVSVACGKYIAFFLDRLTDRVRSGNGALHQLEHDEEMLAYTSGDMQASPEHSWVWAGSEYVHGRVSSITSPSGSSQAPGSEELMQGANPSLRAIPDSPEDSSREWDGWARIEQMMHQLKKEHRARIVQPTAYYPPPHNPVKRLQLAPDAPPSPPRTATVPPSATSSSSRISIANII